MKTRAGQSNGGIAVNVAPQPSEAGRAVLPMNPHLTLTLSPPIGWERRGNSGRMRSVARKLAEQRQVQGNNALWSCGGQRTARPTYLRQGGFTMIEIAIALGVIAFALIAIIGILPVGLNVQRETHQDEVIGQDGRFFLEAIRKGGLATNMGASTSLDFLTNYVESITISSSQTPTTPLIYTNDPKSANYLSNGTMILGLLTTPHITFGSLSNNVLARIRGLTGAATEQSGSNAVTAFRYYMNVEILPFTSISPQSVDFFDYNQTNDPINYGIRLERATEVPYLENNLYEVRLRFSWPVRPNGTEGPGRQIYRSLVSAHLVNYTNNASLYWFFQPNTYNTNFILGL